MNPEPDWHQVHRMVFVCHGNICRSPMAACLMSYLLEQEEVTDVFVDSCATSAEELGNPMYPPAREELRRHGVPVLPHRARQATMADIGNFDLFLCAEEINIRNLARLLGREVLPKCHRLLDFADRPRDIADPWWTGDFSQTWKDIEEGCLILLEKLR